VSVLEYNPLVRNTLMLYHMVGAGTSASIMTFPNAKD